MKVDARRVVPLEELSRIVVDQRFRGVRVGLCHGCFDILHYGHVRHFAAAREHCVMCWWSQ